MLGFGVQRMEGQTDRHTDRALVPSVLNHRNAASISLSCETKGQTPNRNKARCVLTVSSPPQAAPHAPPIYPVSPSCGPQGPGHINLPHFLK